MIIFLHNCVEELPKKPVRRLSAVCWLTVGRQVFFDRFFGEPFFFTITDIWIIFILFSLSFFVMGECKQIDRLFILYHFNNYWSMKSKKYTIRVILPQSTSSNLVYLSFPLCVPLIRSRVSFVHGLFCCHCYFLSMKMQCYWFKIWSYFCTNYCWIRRDSLYCYLHFTIVLTLTQ